MLTVGLATSTAVLFGFADFLGGLASRKESAVSVTAASHGFGAVVFGVAMLLFPAPFDRASVIAGVCAGVSGGIGVSALYAAFAHGRMSVVAPLTAALSGSLPAVYDFATGARISPTAVAGLALAFVATVVVSATSGPDEDQQVGMPLSAVMFSLLAGVGFAGSFLAFSFASTTSGVWPMLSARITSFSMLVAFTLLRGRRLRIAPAARKATLGAGVLDTMANATMVTAIRLGPLAIASVLGSLYPVVTVLLARAVLKERIRGWQRAGVAVAFVAVALTLMK